MKKITSYLTLAALIAGVLFGLYGGEYVTAFEFAGTFYLSFLKYMILPVIFTSISVSIYQSRRNRGHVVIEAVILFAVMFIVSFLISCGIVMLIDPASGFELIYSNYETNIIDLNPAKFLLNLLPQDIKGLLTGKYLFFIITVSYIFGLLAHKFKWEKLMDFIAGKRDFFYKVLSYLMYFTPIAVFSLMGTAVQRFGMETLKSGIKYIITAYRCGLAVMILVMLVPVMLLCKLSVRELLQKVTPIWLVTVSTCSSAATLPYTVKLCKEELEIDPEITDVVVPLGCTIHMCGGAVSFSLLGLFCAKCFGVQLSLGSYLYMLAIAVALNMSAPGIPGGGIVIGASYLEMMGLPLTFIGLYAGIYKILDMLYTTLNVTGDISANVILDHQMKKAKSTQ